MNFKIGQKVVALTNPPDDTCQPRVKGKIYTVIDVLYCHKCGIQSINLGYKAVHANVVECICGVDKSNEGLRWTLSSLFAPLDNLESSITEAVEKEDYETAQLLHDILNETHQEL